MCGSVLTVYGSVHTESLRTRDTYAYRPPAPHSPSPSPSYTTHAPRSVAPQEYIHTIKTRISRRHIKPKTVLDQTVFLTILWKDVMSARSLQTLKWLC